MIRCALPLNFQKVLTVFYEPFDFVLLFVSHALEGAGLQLPQYSLWTDLSLTLIKPGHFNDIRFGVYYFDVWFAMQLSQPCALHPLFDDISL